MGIDSPRSATARPESPRHAQSGTTMPDIDLVRTFTTARLSLCPWNTEKTDTTSPKESCLARNPPAVTVSKQEGRPRTRKNVIRATGMNTCHAHDRFSSGVDRAGDYYVIFPKESPWNPPWPRPSLIDGANWFRSSPDYVEVTAKRIHYQPMSTSGRWAKSCRHPGAVTWSLPTVCAIAFSETSRGWSRIAIGVLDKRMRTVGAHRHRCR